jgi:hypothetical protein
VSSDVPDKGHLESRLPDEAERLQGIQERLPFFLAGIQRLLWLEQKTVARGGVLTEGQLRLLRRYRGKLTDPEQHLEAPAPASCFARTPTS